MPMTFILRRSPVHIRTNRTTIPGFDNILLECALEFHSLYLLCGLKEPRFSFCVALHALRTRLKSLYIYKFVCGRSAYRRYALYQCTWWLAAGLADWTQTLCASARSWTLFSRNLTFAEYSKMEWCRMHIWNTVPYRSTAPHIEPMVSNDRKSSSIPKSSWNSECGRCKRVNNNSFSCSTLLH